MTENTLAVLNFFKKHTDKEYVKREVADITDIPMQSLTAIVNGLVKKGLLHSRLEELPPPIYGAKPIKIYWISITDEGKEYDDIAEERRKREEKLAAAAERKRIRLQTREERARQNLVL